MKQSTTHVVAGIEVKPRKQAYMDPMMCILSTDWRLQPVGEKSVNMLLVFVVCEDNRLKRLFCLGMHV